MATGAIPLQRGLRQTGIVGHPTTKGIFTAVAFLVAGFFIRSIQTPYYNRLCSDTLNGAQKELCEMTVNNQVLKEVFVGAIAAALFMYLGMHFMGWVEKRLWEQLETHQN